MSDLISRQEAIEWVKNLLDINRYYHPHSKSEKFPISEVIDVLERIPTAEPEQKKGHWIHASMSDYKCSVCGEVVLRHKYRFCPGCGAELEE